MTDLEPGLFFILGRGRSGTTMLRTMLDVHPRISVPPEAMFVMMLSGKYGRVDLWTHQRIAEFVSDLGREKRLVRWGLDMDALEEDLRSLGRGASYADVCRQVYRSYAVQQGKDQVGMIGDKNPHYCLFSGVLAGLFEKAKFIHMVRDPRANVMSFRNVRFDLNGVSALAYRWKAYNQAVISCAKRLPDRFYRIRFEDLLKNPPACMRGICDFLGVEFDPVMLSFQDRASGVPDWDWHRNVSGALDPGRADAWKRSMDPKDVCTTERICSGLIDELGYQTACDGAEEPGKWKTIPGTFYGWLITGLEKLAFRLPLPLRSGIINLYRRLTGSMPDQGPARPQRGS